METNDAPFTLTVLNVKSGNNDVPPTAIMQLSGHKNVQSITRYYTVSAAAARFFFFSGAVLSGGHIGVAINTLNQSPTLSV